MIFGSTLLENAIFIVLLTGGYGYLPDASQEGILRPFRSYSDVTMFHYHVPPETLRATWQFAAFADSPECPSKQVHIYLQHGSYPLINASTSNFPPNAFIGRTSLHLITTQSSFEPRNPTVFPVYNPLPGNWYAAAYVLNWDKQVKQEGISRKCHYSLGSVSLWSRVKEITIIGTGASKEVFSTGTYSYYKFYIPAHTWNFSLKVSNCSYRVSSLKGKAVQLAQFCIKNLALSAKALPSTHQKEAVSNLTEGNGHTFVVTEPFSECYYYLLVESEARISFNVEIIVEECRYEMLLRNDFKKVEHVEELFKSATLYTAKRENETEQHSRIKFSSKRMVRSGGKSFSHVNQETCPPVFHLMRIKHSEDFAVTFLLEGDGWSTNWISLSDFFVTYAALEIQPFVDIGGTLSIDIGLDDLQLNSTKKLVIVTVCIKPGSVPKITNGSILCSSELKMTVTSSNVSSSEAKKLVPFPEPGTWFFGFHLKCFANGSIVPCGLADILLKLNVQLHRCVFPIDSCGSYGICQETHKGLHHFTSCFCLGGYNGWGCTDARNAIHHSTLLLSTLLLTLSNIFFIPAIVLAVRQSMISEALVYLATMMFSMLYHACDEDFYSYCVTKYEVLQFCDFFCSIFSFWVTLIATANVPTHLVSAFQVVGVIIIAFGVESNRTGLLAFVIPSGLGSLIPLFYWCFRSYKQSRILFHLPSFLKILLGILLATSGLVMFAFVETEANYQYVHSAWHIVIALSLVFLLPRVVKKSGSYPQSCDTELYDINNLANSVSVLDVGSDEDNLITS